LIRNSK